MAPKGSCWKKADYERRATTYWRDSVTSPTPSHSSGSSVGVKTQYDARSKRLMLPGVLDAQNDNELLLSDGPDGFVLPTILEPGKSYGPNNEFCWGKLEKAHCLPKNFKYPRMIGIGVSVEQFGHVEIKDHTFKAQLLVWLDWQLTQDEVKEWYASGQAARPMPDFNVPGNIACLNACEIVWMEEFGTPKMSWVPNRGKIYARCGARVMCTFVENYELECFPFDVQDLTMVWELGNAAQGSDFWRLQPTEAMVTSLKVDLSYSAVDDYYIGHPYLGFLVTKKKDSIAYQTYSQAHLVLKVKRRSEHYLYRMMFALSMVSLYSLAAPLQDEFNDQLAHLATMLLTAVAFNFVVQQQLPVIPYLTFMDRFILGEFGFIFLLCLTTVFSILCYDLGYTEIQVHKHYYGIGGLCGVWFLGHAWLYFESRRYRCIENRKLNGYAPPEGCTIHVHKRNIQLAGSDPLLKKKKKEELRAAVLNGLDEDPTSQNSLERKLRAATLGSYTLAGVCEQVYADEKAEEYRTNWVNEEPEGVPSPRKHKPILDGEREKTCGEDEASEATIVAHEQKPSHTSSISLAPVATTSLDNRAQTAVVNLGAIPATPSPSRNNTGRLTYTL